MHMRAVEKIRDEMAENHKSGYVQAVGNYLLGLLERYPGAAEKIMAEGKTIKDSLKAMQAEARKHQVDGCGVLTDEEGFAVVRSYYGIDAERAHQAAVRPSRDIDFDISLDDLLNLAPRRG
jgi:hypothetical protein